MDQMKSISTSRSGIRGVGRLDGSQRFACGFDSLPTELISAVFVRCLPADFRTVKQPNKLEAPILLCHVCRNWRRLAFDTRELWSNLHVKINTFLNEVKGSVLKGRSVSPKSRDFLDWWGAKLVTNSRSHPFALDLRIDTDARYHSDCFALQTTYRECDIETDEYSEFLSGYLITSAQNLSLSLREDDFRMLCSTSLAGFLHLEYLTLHTFVDTIIRHHKWRQFPSAPQLRRLHLTTYNCRLLFTFPKQTGAHLTHFCISRNISSQIFRYVLTVLCPNLLCGAFSLYPLQGEDFDRKPPTCIANLRQLVLSGPIALGAAFVQFFTGFCFQSLSSLRLQLSTDSEIDISTLIDLFRATPNIVELHLPAQLFCLPDTHEGMDYGTQSSYTSLGKILPKLKILRLEMTDAVNGTTKEYFQRLIQSNFFRPSESTGHSGRVEVVFETPSQDGDEEKENSTTSQSMVSPAGLFPAMGNAAERSLLADLQAYVSAERHTLHCDIVFRQSSDLRQGWSQISTNLSRWEEAMAFYEII